MKFNTWLENKMDKAIFCDLDETLVCTKPLDSILSYLGSPEAGSAAERFAKLKQRRANYDSKSKEEQIDFWKEMGGKHFDYDGTAYITFARPYSHEFLSSLSNVYILTSGGTKFQSVVIKLHGFHVKDIFGRDRYGAVPKYDSLLIDDLDTNTLGVHEKLQAIGSDKHIKVSPWSSIGKEDNELLRILPIIEAFWEG